MLPLTDWIARLFEHPDLVRMGHDQRAADLNLGLGWLYYAAGRIVRPSRAVVIGSYRGFVPLVVARALADNTAADGSSGQVHFIDPSLVDDQWRDAQSVQSHFGSFGITNITHHLMTTQQFTESDAYRRLCDLGIVFIDGYHTAEQAAIDFDAFAGKLAPDGMILLHDSVWPKRSRIYGAGQEYEHDVLDFVAELKGRPEWQVFDLPFGSGLTLVRRSAMAAAPWDGQVEPVAAGAVA